MLFWTAVAVCVVAQAAIFRALLAPHEAASAPETVPRPRTGAEVAWALAPALGLALVLALTWRAIHGPSPHAERMRVSGGSAAVSRP